MARPRASAKIVEDIGQPSFTPAMTLEDQEDQLVALAVDLAIKRLREGTASNQLVSELIRMGTTKEKLAKEKLKRENEMLRAKTEALEAAKSNGEKYAAAIQAMRIYSGMPDIVDEDEYEDY